MMLPSTLKMLHRKDIVSTSQCIQLAMNMTQAQFEGLCEGGRPCWALFHRYMERDDIRREFDERWEGWNIKQYATNNVILGGLGSNDMVRRTIAKNQKKIRDIEGSVAQAFVPGLNQGNASQNKEKPMDTDMALGIVAIAVICWFLVRYFGSA